MGDGEGPDLEAELGWELWKMRELGFGGGHSAARLRARGSEELKFVLRAGVVGEELGGVDTRSRTHLPDWAVKHENANRYIHDS